MAISFAYLAPVHLSEHGGAASTVAYVARAIVHDPRFEQAFDYTHLRGDLAHEEIILPENCSSIFLDRSALAIALDNAELRKVRTPLPERKRPPQVGLALVLALPPSNEVSVDEAAEIMRRIVLAARGSVTIPIHTAIHDAGINRHAHALFALRPADRDGVLGQRVRDFVVRHRHTKFEDADVVEGIHWPNLSWEIHQAYFHELAIDLVVDPIAPKPGTHFSPVVFRSGKIDSRKTGEQIASSRQEAYADNVSMIEGSPTHLVETLLRGRSTLRIAELERLCAKFYDIDVDQTANVERILLDQNVITLADPPGASKPTYATTRHIKSLLARASRLIEHPAQNDIKVFTGANEACVLPQISAICATSGMRDRPLILGAKLSHCDAAKAQLAPHAPIVGTIDMAIAGPRKLRLVGRKRDVRLRRGRIVIVPHSEMIDDQRLARLILATSQVGSGLVLGHDQSSKTGVVCRHLAAHAADCAAREYSPNGEDHGSTRVERLLRAGLVRHAIDEMENGDLLEFGIQSHHTNDILSFIVCDDPRRVDGLCQTIRQERIRSGSIGKPVPLPGVRKGLELSVREWILTTTLANTSPLAEKTEFAQILAIDPLNGLVDVIRSSERKQIDLKCVLGVRPAAVLSIREARGLPAEAKVVVEATDPRRLWSALLFVATRGSHARLHLDPRVAQNKAGLIDVARRSLPGALPQQRSECEDPDAGLSRIVLQITTQLETLPDTTPVEIKPPWPSHATEDVRRLLSNDWAARNAYKLLYEFVGPHNPDQAANAKYALSRFSNELTKTIIRFLAGIESDSTLSDLPPELNELESERWTYLEFHQLRSDLYCLNVPGQNCPINPISRFTARRLSHPRRTLTSMTT
ncbi:hypothetical protein GGD66_003970 [Bradyrhizobium sp. CIR48]|uniref:MobA/MobL family protein n=1 Tax=Bradyrhizobium sp. CIR48 TaxID=2663840 RepID=UPI001605F57E|nr:MobA/MobL family protein [Bradyrhizobium sp. CIR48]MBB4425413.1 hypothetical protein [Bradyrhizobium sp. CIR48]